MSDEPEMLIAKNMITGEERKVYLHESEDFYVDENGFEIDWRDWYVSEPLSPKVIQAIALLFLVTLMVLFYLAFGGAPRD